MEDQKYTCKGFTAGAVEAAIKAPGRLDLGLIFCDSPATVAALFTTNQVQAAPVLLDKERVAGGTCRAVVANSGNANCCTGSQGMADARQTANLAANALGVDESQVLVASTGVIGKPLDMDRFTAAMPPLVRAARPDGFVDFSRAILTTDTYKKIYSKTVAVGEQSFTILGTCKGSGMIRPDMATMLCFVMTDIAADQAPLQAALKKSTDNSFHLITVDGDTSTNDTVLLMASGASGVKMADCEQEFQAALDEVLLYLAKEMAADGEGATCLFAVEVKGAVDDADAKMIADTVAHSPLVKTAVFGKDANWGRIMMAAGRSGARVNQEKVDISFDAVQVVKQGLAMGEAAEEQAAKVLRQKEFAIKINLNLGEGAAVMYTCDYSLDYIKINADYRT